MTADCRLPPACRLLPLAVHGWGGGREAISSAHQVQTVSTLPLPSASLRNAQQRTVQEVIELPQIPDVFAILDAHLTL